MRARLALKFGCSIRALGDLLPAEEWPVFIALYELEPWDNDDFNSAKICSTVANMSGRTLKRNSTPQDFMVTRG